MAEAQPGAEHVRFHDVAEIYHPGFSVAIDGTSTEIAENFIHAESPDRVVVSASDITQVVSSSDGLAALGEAFVESPTDSSTGQWMTWLPREVRRELGYTDETLVPQPVLSLGIQRIDGTDSYQVFMTRAKTSIYPVLPGVLNSQLSDPELLERSGMAIPWLQSTAATIKGLADTMGEAEYLFHRVTDGQPVAVDMKSAIEDTRRVLLKRRDLGMQEYNNFAMGIFNMLQAQYMYVNDIPGVVMEIEDGKGVFFRTTADELEDGAFVTSGFTVPTCSAMHAIAHANLYAFMENPQDPEYPFPNEDLQQMLLAMRKRNDERRAGPLMQNVGRLMQLGDVRRAS